MLVTAMLAYIVILVNNTTKMFVSTRHQLLEKNEESRRQAVMMASLSEVAQLVNSTLDINRVMTRIMDGLIDLLDNWVENDIAPPPTKSDWAELGDVNGDGINENQAIAPPEVACPLGLYYPYPASREGGGIGTTGFAAFDGKSLEPHDGRGIFVDMNLNRYLDYRESVEQAWHRLGLLKAGEKFTRSAYQACVEDAVAKLQSEKFISARVAVLYIEEAARENLPGL
ncbi:MAG: hypothetical protein IH919_07190, partial [Deltaproteobacteria bacterium]|nr:hypothetical protein [Deltaproteobacteria bacterium]